MHLKALTAVLMVAVFSAVFASAGHAKALSQTITTNSNNKVTVGQGDTLSGIAKRHATTYVRLYNANPNVQDPNLIYPGEILRLPAATEQLPDRFKPAAAPAPAAPTAALTSVPAAAPVSSTPAPAAISRPAAPAPTVTAPAIPSSGVWYSLAQCESGGNWSISTGNGFYGGLQFTLSSWHAVGGSGYPNQASASEQIARAQILQARQGWGAWPVCSAKLGLS